LVSRWDRGLTRTTLPIPNSQLPRRTVSLRWLIARAWALWELGIGSWELIEGVYRTARGIGLQFSARSLTS
jgi:hypothetical protein